MKFQLYGKVIDRSKRTVTKKDGTSYDVFSMVIEEPGVYPSRFRIESKTADVFGPKDGPCAVGKMVTASGFVNGSEREGKDKEGRPTKYYSTYLSAREVKGAEPDKSAEDSAAEETTAEDVPF